MLAPSDHTEKMLSANLKERQSGTCDWIFNLPEYKQWFDADQSALLWVYGNAGCGKTVLMAAMIDKLRQLANDNGSVVAYSFCTRSGNTDATSSALSVKRDLVYRLYERLKDASNLALVNSKLSCDMGKDSKLGQPDTGLANTSRLTRRSNLDSDVGIFTELTDALVALARLLEFPVYLLIDSPDECSDFDNELIESVRAWSGATGANIKMVCTTRPRSDSEKFSATIHRVDVEKHNKPDIVLKVKGEVSMIPGLSEQERRLVIDSIVERAATHFSYIAPATDLLRQPWKRPIDRVITQMSNGIHGMYQQNLRKTNPFFIELAKLALQWTLLRQETLPMSTLFDIYSNRFVVDSSTVDGIDDHSGVISGSNGETNLPASTFPDTVWKQQIGIAAGDFINVVGMDNRLEESHKSVNDCFVRKGTAPMVHTSNESRICAKCERDIAMRDDFHVYTEDHLHIATRILQHLNSEAFRKLYFRKLPEAFLSAGSDGATDTSSESQSIADAESLDELEEGAGAPGDIPYKTDYALERYLKLQKLFLTRTSEYDDFDSDDEIDASGLKTIPPEANDSVKPEPKRYEMFAWISHIKEAQKVLGTDESQCPQSWQNLWVQLRTFFSDDQKWKAWLYTILGIVYTDDNGKANEKELDVTPLHYMATFGLTWVVRRLLADGLDTVTSVSVNELLPLAYLQLDDDMDEDLNLLELLSTGLEVSGVRGLRAARRNSFLALLTRNPTQQFLERLINIYMRFEKNLGFTDTPGNNALHYVALCGTHVGLVPILQKHGVDINARGEDGTTPLQDLVGTRIPKIELIDEFLQHDADINFENWKSVQALAFAVEQGSLSVIQKLIECGADVRDTNVVGFSALHKAVIARRVDITEALLDAGARLDDVSSVEGYSPLYLACCFPDETVARCLLTRFEKDSPSWSIAEVDRKNLVGKTPLRKACTMGQINTVKSLLKYAKAEDRIHVVDKRRGQSPLHAAAIMGRQAIVELLIDRGANVNLCDKAGKTALDLCSEGWHRDPKLDYTGTALTLMAKNPEAAAKNRLLMMAAATYGSKEVVEKLLEFGAVYEFKDKHNWSPILTARYHGHIEVVHTFECEDSKGRPPDKMTPTSDFPGLSSDSSSNTYQHEGTLSGAWMLTHHPIPANSKKYYFEVTVLATDPELKPGFVAIGLSTAIIRVPMTWSPGDGIPGVDSWGYYSNTLFEDGGLLKRHDMKEFFERKLYQPYGPGDTIGCSLFAQNGAILYTRNGKSLGVAFNGAKGRLFPAIGLLENAAVSVNLGTDLVAKPFLWAAANSGDYTIYSK